MDLSEIKTKLKVLFNQQLSDAEKQTLKDYLAKLETLAPPAHVSLKEAKTKNGEILSYEGDLVEGMSINMVSESGSAPCPDGEYELVEDGTKISVASGKISKIEKPAPAGNQLPQMSEAVKQMETKFSSQISEIISARFAEQKKEYDKKIADLTEQVKFAYQTLDKILNVPVDNLAVEKPVKEKKYEEMTNYEKLKFNRGEKA